MDGLALSKSREDTAFLGERSNPGRGNQGAKQQEKRGHPKLKHEEYTVGWLCALKCEFNAARALLLGSMKGHKIL
ncbi:uncharacterized protein BDW70DRAFT_140038 [Aspergillus foveolatus]|uniref:uncharacterized protein n=1 Tax=Aspergillus foveolatus TaxID=210207 RepID=UPI003CCD80D9